MAKKSTTPTILTTKQAAEVMNVPTTAGMRSLARFARERGIELLAPQELWPDLRTPMYDEAKLVHYRDVQRPNRQWNVSIEDQKKAKAEREAARKTASAGAKKS